MELYIQIKDGQPHEHPIFGDNFRQAFPHIDVNNLPPTFARFERVERPVIGPYEKNQRVQYEWVMGVVKDVWYVEQMTEQEKLAKQQAVKDGWAANGFPSWTFNEATCTFDPPTPHPEDGKLYRWDEPTLSWIEAAQ